MIVLLECLMACIRFNDFIIIINLNRIAVSTRSVGLHAGPQHIHTNIITTNKYKLQ